MQRPRFWHHLHWRIWLAVMAAVLLTTVLVSSLMHHFNESLRQPRVLQIRDAAGQVLAETQVQAPRPGQRMQVPIETVNGQKLEIVWLRADGVVATVPQRAGPHKGPYRSGPAPRAEGSKDARRPMTWNRIWPPRGVWGTAFWLTILALAIGVGAYPVAQRMSTRLQRLQRSVESWGQGHLDVRVEVTGEDEVACLAQRFNEAASRIEALLQSQKNLLANTSHELRTPLARLRMALGLVAEGGINPSTRAEMERNIDELDELVEEILLRSRLEAQSQEVQGAWQSVDLIGLAAQEAAREGVAMSVSLSPCEVPGHEKLLQRLIRNLLQNAKRYGGAADGLALEIGPAAQAGQCWLDVLDRGPGVPEALREKVFQPFYRLPQVAEHEGGVGLGLALVRSIAEHHGGQVQCLPREGGGTCFRVSLPLQSAA